MLDADPHYFRGAPAIARIEIAIVPDPNTIATLWQAGKLDLVIGAGADRARVPRRAARVRRTPTSCSSRTTSSTSCCSTRRRPPLDDARVRRALAQAIDRARIMRDLDGELWVPGESDRLPGQFAYDPGAASAALRPGRRRARARRRRLARCSPTAAAQERPHPGAGLRRDDRVADDRALRAARPAGPEPGSASAATSSRYAYNLIWAQRGQHGIYKSGRFDLTYTGWQPNAVADHSYLFRCDTRPPDGDNLGGICDPVIERAARAGARHEPTRPAKRPATAP